MRRDDGENGWSTPTVHLDLWKTVDDLRMTNWSVTCPDVRSSPIHSPYNYDTKIFLFLRREAL